MRCFLLSIVVLLCFDDWRRCFDLSCCSNTFDQVGVSTSISGKMGSASHFVAGLLSEDASTIVEKPWKRRRTKETIDCEELTINPCQGDGVVWLLDSDDEYVAVKTYRPLPSSERK